MRILKTEHLTLRFPDQPMPVLQEINLEIPESSLTVILGESGCGKTTLLNILAGFQEVNCGVVKIDHEILHGPDARRAVVFQDHALLPWLNVADNVGFSLKIKGQRSAEIQQKVDQILQTVGLSHVAKSNIWELSGGMKQRVGIARALISDAPFILLDEPFAALDAFTRENMQEFVLDLWIQQNTGFFLITHDIEEALLLSNQLVLMSARPGRIVEILNLKFAERYRQGESIRSIKSDPQFIQLREQLFERLKDQKLQGMGHNHMTTHIDKIDHESLKATPEQDVYFSEPTDSHQIGFIQQHLSMVISILSVLTILLLWFIVSALELIPALFLPSPAAVWQKFLEVSQQGFMKATLWQHLAESIGRVFSALIFAIVIGVPLGLWMGLNRWTRAILDPLVELIRPIPPLAYLPLLVIWFGIGEITKILLIFISILTPIMISTTHGVLSHQQNRERAALSLGATRFQVLQHVILPTALPHILTGIRIGLGVGWSTLVAAELVAADRGIGFMVQSAAQFLITDTVILGIIVIAIVAVSFELFLRWLQKQLAPWYGQQI